jgi:hypothetical protein
MNKTLVKSKIVLEDDGKTMTTYIWEKWFWFFGIWIPHGTITCNKELPIEKTEIVTKEAVSKVFYDNFIHPKRIDVMEEYNKAKEALYEHVGGFVEDYVVCPIDDCTEAFWDYNSAIVRFADTKELFFSSGKYMQDDIYTQRFYNQWVYEGEKYTMIFCNPGVDGMKWFRIFDNSKRIEMQKDSYYSE